MRLEGMVTHIKSLKEVSFVLIQLMRWTVQCVLEWVSLGLIDWVKKGDFVRLKWTPRLSEKARGWVEVALNGVEIIATGDTEWVQFHRPMKENIETLLANRVVTLRNREQQAIFRLAHWLSTWFREFLVKAWFTEIHTPKIVANSAEWGANVFKLDYFWRQASLAQSPQFYKQFMVPVFHRVFEIAPAFRAEKHNTARHINEYTSLDLEMWPISGYRDVMEMEVRLLRDLMNYLQENFADEIEFLGVKLPDISNGIPEVTFDEAKEIASQRLGKPIDDPDDLAPEEERAISAHIQETTWSDFVFVSRFPKTKRPFYTMPSTDNDRTTEGFDLLFRGLEVTTWGQRIHDYDMQISAIREKWLDPANFEDFLALHKAWTLPHGGIGIGSERLLQKLVGKDNIRATTLFPRDGKRLTP